MRYLRLITTLVVVASFGCGWLAWADDGEKTSKSMSNTIKLPIFEQDIVNDAVPENEHAFIDMMDFYVPMQAASGNTLFPDLFDGKDPTSYLNIDGVEVENLDVARPLISVFLHGPAFGVYGTAFAHSFFDVYGAVSLDDGSTWKQTNLSEAADLTSFDLDVDHVPSPRDPLPGDHRILLGSQNNGAWHADGYKMPFTAHCMECHGPALTGTAQAPSCYSCHDSRWKEDPLPGVGPIVYEAVYKNSKLQGKGENALPKAEVMIVNGTTGEYLFSVDSTNKGYFDFVERPQGLPPCTVAAISGDEEGQSLTVTDKDGEPLEQCEGSPLNVTNYPGGSHNVFHATAGNKVLVAWPSRFCEQGQPAYSFAYDADPLEDPSDELVVKREMLANFLGIDVTRDLYLTDLFGVAGKQGSINFADEGYPQAGIVPFGCVWTARGVLVPGDDPRTENLEESHMVWTKAERITSGRRDPNRIEVSGVRGAGFVITWQEDPEGIRPGQGLGPGEGWSGAVGHPKTDIWYSFIPWEYFDLVEQDADLDGVPDATPINIAEHDLLTSGRPQIFVPMAVPMRVTNNDKCVATEYGPGMTPSAEKAFSYCNYDVAQDYGLQDFCADVIFVPSGPNGEPNPICVNEDGLPNIANTASTRPRLSLQGYSSANDGVTDSAWVILATEESKGLGRYAFLPDGTPCNAEDPESSPDCTADIGKNQWYFSFDMGDPATSATAGEPYGLVQNLVNQGNMLNQPEVDWRTGEFYPVTNTIDMWDFGAYNFDLYNTEIARRASILVQPIAKAEGSNNKLLAIMSWKQGAMRQGGPADTMLRRFVLPFGYSEGIANNPYAFTNMVCDPIGGSDSWILNPGDNPYYPDGLCGAPATNLSGAVPDTCKDDETGALVACPTVDFTSSTYGIGDTNPILQGYVQGEGNTQRVLTWHQCPSDGGALDTSELEGPYVDCDSDFRTDAFVNLRDQSWYNPLDISKGHRGFVDGDFVMFLYAWSPTWRLNAKGNDRYDLYIRRSFDGGNTWTTLPGSFAASNGLMYSGDGTVTCENYRSTVTQTSGAPEPSVCYEYPVGGNEQARNVTQHQRMRTTTLDPRYAASRSSITETCVTALGLPDTVDSTAWSCDDTSSDYDADTRDPSRYFIVYETGDNSTVAVGEAEPLDLFYSRAENFGDDYVVWAETDTATADPSLCYPSNAHEDDGIIGKVIEYSGFCNEFDRMNSGQSHSSEANLEASPDGSKLYAVWAQWVFDESGEEVEETDAELRRIWWIDDYISADPDLTWTLPGTNQSSTTDGGTP